MIIMSLFKYCICIIFHVLKGYSCSKNTNMKSLLEKIQTMKDCWKKKNQ